MLQRTPAARLGTAALILMLPASMMPVPAAEVGASLTGSILTASDRAPMSGAKVHLADVSTGSIRSSLPAASDGSFLVRDVPAATYELAVESAGQLYLVGTPVSLAPGQAEIVNLAVNAAVAAQTSAGTTTASKPKRKKGTSPWNNPLTAGLVVVGGAVVLGAVINEATKDDDEPQQGGGQPPSPSQLDPTR